jgi:putative redox protein
MVRIDVVYEGKLHTRATHEPSQSVIATDAPKDNMGLGEAFSPTDLLATSLATCILTTMGIVAQREQIDMAGATATVIKEMTTTPPRRVAKLTVTINMPAALDEVQTQKLTNAANACPVKKSLHPDVVVETTINWGA